MSRQWIPALLKHAAPCSRDLEPLRCKVTQGSNGDGLYGCCYIVQNLHSPFVSVVFLYINHRHESLLPGNGVSQAGLAQRGNPGHKPSDSAHVQGPGTADLGLASDSEFLFYTSVLHIPPLASSKL